MLKQFACGLFLAANVSFAYGQDTTPLIGSQAQSQEQATDLIAPVLNDGVERVLVIGDSMSGGLGAGMARMATDDPNIQITSRFNESSGITRPDIYDWAAAIPKIMEGKNFSSVVVLIGLNDRQDIRTSTGRYVFNSPEWIVAYQANIDAIADALKAQNVKVFWLSEPPMGDANYDADMKLVSALQQKQVTAKGANYVDTRPQLSNPDGTYMDFGPDDTGEVKKLRQRDGVTFLKQGNNKFGQIVLAALKAGGQGTVVSPDTPLAETPDVGGPVFGQADANGVAVLHNSNTIDATALQNASAANVDSTDTPLTATSPSVEKLFTTGEADVAPLGRFDDFSYVAPKLN